MWPQLTLSKRDSKFYFFTCKNWIAVELTPVAFFTVTVILISLMLGLSFVTFVLAMSVFIYRCGPACENSRFSSLFGAGEVARGGTSATQRQKFHTDDVKQCLHNKSGIHGVPNASLFNFKLLLVDFGKVLCSSANKLQQNSNTSSREEYIPQILTVLLEIHRVYIWPLWPFVFCLSFVNNS